MNYLYSGTYGNSVQGTNSSSNYNNPQTSGSSSSHHQRSKSHCSGYPAQSTLYSVCSNCCKVCSTVVLYRKNENTPWGFRLQGGKDCNMQLSVKQTKEGSPAYQQLHMGDVILFLNGADVNEMSHEEATKAIVSSGTSLQLTVAKPCDCLIVCTKESCQ